MSQNEQKFNEIAEHLNLTDNVDKGNMFGAKCLKLNKKAFAMFHQDEMIFKLPADASLMGLEGVRPFEPMPGRPMNGWIQVPYRYSEQWEDLSVKALNHLRQLSE
ncbi:hypothetical protein [Cohnella silvisoli]|uniref:TfoX N-terminal domain-containing protein n=1 Tax=Cohnella silvisoli TaxID=2873699 RepID=A0ABV1KMU7_9BACL|nr:hypothetical protein [Cohnella silvisoli]MCD9020286.1 hypothetical protein [Cohnella silvisoli]